MTHKCIFKYTVSGNPEEIARFARLLNTMPNHTISNNRFGRYWLGNIFIAMGADEEDIRKGRIYSEGAFFPWVIDSFDPEPDDSKEFTIDNDGKMRFSSLSVWGHSKEITDLIKARFPSIRMEYSAEDEYGDIKYWQQKGLIPKFPCPVE